MKELTEEQLKAFRHAINNAISDCEEEIEDGEELAIAFSTLENEIEYFFEEYFK